VHRLADDVFPQHRPEGGAAIAATRVPRLPGTFQLNVDALAGRRDLFAEQDRPSVPECREVSVLMTRVRLCDRPRPFREHAPCEDRRAVRPVERVRIEAQRDRQRPVERHQTRCGRR